MVQLEVQAAPRSADLLLWPPAVVGGVHPLRSLTSDLRYVTYRLLRFRPQTGSGSEWLTNQQQRVTVTSEQEGQRK